VIVPYQRWFALTPYNRIDSAPSKEKKTPSNRNEEEKRFESRPKVKQAFLDNISNNSKNSILFAGQRYLVGVELKAECKKRHPKGGVP
jgi:hypothetical protein